MRRNEFLQEPRRTPAARVRQQTLQPLTVLTEVRTPLSLPPTSPRRHRAVSVNTPCPSISRKVRRGGTAHGPGKTSFSSRLSGGKPSSPGGGSGAVTSWIHAHDCKHECRMADEKRGDGLDWRSAEGRGRPKPQTVTNRIKCSYTSHYLIHRTQMKHRDRSS